VTTLIDILEAIGSFIIGAAGRIGLFLAAGLALALPALAIALVRRGLARGSRPAERGLEARVAPNHTWIEPRGAGTLMVGIDEVAERLLPSATAIELPLTGMTVHRGDPIVVIRSGKRAVRIGAPVDGTIAAVNRRLRRSPGLVKEEPYGRGWLFSIMPAGEGWKDLPGGLRADAWMLSEKRRLARFVEDELGMAAADGGELVAPAPVLLGDDAWKRVIAAFLHAA
jgi:glycine cleavage system H protein